MTQGNKRLQQHNRRKNNRRVPRQDELYRTIDGNKTYQPYGYCWYHRGYLTRNQAIRHSCHKKCCKRFQKFEDYQARFLVKESINDEASITSY